jgi:O-methyltransferase
MKKIRNFLSIFKKYKYDFDNVKTNNNLYFLEEKKFNESYWDIKNKINFLPDIPLRVHQAIWCAENASRIDGDIVELGTGKGFLFLNIMSHSEDMLKHKNIYLCDTFLPYKTDINTGSQLHSNGVSSIYAPSYEYVESCFKKWTNIFLVKGYLPESLSNENSPKISSISFLHVDLNFHEVEISCLEMLWDKVVCGGLILLDDFGNPGRERQMDAHINFFNTKNQSILCLASGQGLIIKRSI